MVSVDVGAGLRGSNLGVNGNLKVRKTWFYRHFGRSFYNNASTVLEPNNFAEQLKTLNQTSAAKI
jgi:hypothetical protein